MTIRAIVPDYYYWRSQIRCLSNCPVNTNAAAYIQAIKEDDLERAYLIARNPNPLASICGRICGAPCEINCRRKDLDHSVATRALKGVITDAYATRSETGQVVDKDMSRDQFLSRFSRYRSGSIHDIAALWELAQAMPVEPLSVGIIGGGPAGLACAHDLAVLGHHPIVYEAESLAAGNLFLVIPPYRRPPHDMIFPEIEFIRTLGGKMLTGMKVGREISLNEIRHRHDRTVIAVGAGRSCSLSIPGIGAAGVWGGVEFLRNTARGTPLKVGPEIVVIGGGMVAYDVARTALRLPSVSKVTLCCLEARDEMPADSDEIEKGDEEGLGRLNRVGPKEILTDEQGRLQGVVLQKVLSVFDDQGRVTPDFDPEALQEIKADTVILCIGQRTDLSFLGPDEEITWGSPGKPLYDGQSQRTSAPDVYVAGDAAHGPRLIIHAIASGKRCALEIHAEAVGKRLGALPRFRFQELASYVRSRDYDTKAGISVSRTTSTGQGLAATCENVEIGYGPDEAREEAGRCLQCSVFPVFNSERCLLCGGCADACPHHSIYLVRVSHMDLTPGLAKVLENRYGSMAAAGEGSVILKDDDLCIRCGICSVRCPVGAITMERIILKESIGYVR